MKKTFGQVGVIRILPLLTILAAVGIISFLLISSTLPLGGLLGILNSKPASHAEDPITSPITGPLGTPLPLVLNSITPSAGNTESTITLSGNGFGDTFGFVLILTSTNTEYEAATTSWSNTKIQAIIPGFLTGNQIVQIFVEREDDNGLSNPLNYQILLGQPQINSVTPQSVAPGGTITISGSGYGSNVGKVNFYQNYPNIAGHGQISSWSDTEIKLVIPTTLTAGAEYAIEVQTSGDTHSSFNYYILGGSIQGDIDGDGRVTIFDYNILVGNFNMIGSGIPGDVDSSGKVDIFDYNILVGNFTK